MAQYTACKNCTDRHEGCHGQCTKYKAARLARDIRLDMRMKKLRPEYDLNYIRINRSLDIREGKGK